MMFTLKKNACIMTTKAEVEWKFARAVVENQYRKIHCIVVPFNLLSSPVVSVYLRANGNSRQEDADNRRREYRTYYHHRLFPLITARYKKKYGGSFPLSVEEKIDLMMEKLQISPGFDHESTLENQGEVDLLVDRDYHSTSIVAHSPRNESESNGAEAKPSLTDCHMEVWTTV